MKINCYKKDVDGREAVRAEILEERTYPGKGKVDTQVFVTGLWADSLPEDPMAVLSNRMANYLDRPLSDGEKAELEAAYAAV